MRDPKATRAQQAAAKEGEELRDAGEEEEDDDDEDEDDELEEEDMEEVRLRRR